MEIRWKPIEQMRQVLVNGGRVDEMIIIQDKDHFAWQSRELVCQRCQQRIQPGRPRRLVGGCHCCDLFRSTMLERTKQTGAEPCHIIVAFIQR